MRMPVLKFRSIEEMKQRPWRQPADPSLCRSMQSDVEST